MNCHYLTNANMEKKRKSRPKHNILYKNLTHGDYKKIALATGVHYQTVRNTLTYGLKNEAVLKAAEKISAFNDSLKAS